MLQVFALLYCFEKLLQLSHRKNFRQLPFLLGLRHLQLDSDLLADRDEFFVAQAMLSSNLDYLLDGRQFRISVFRCEIGSIFNGFSYQSNSFWTF